MGIEITVGRFGHECTFKIDNQKIYPSKCTIEMSAGARTRVVFELPSYLPVRYLPPNISVDVDPAGTVWSMLGGKYVLVPEDRIEALRYLFLDALSCGVHDKFPLDSERTPLAVWAKGIEALLQEVQLIPTLPAEGD
jgi:hypothetical protein